MDIQTEPLEDHQIRLTVSIEQDRFDQVKRRAARKLSKETKIPGFRPGKAPYRIVQRHVGEAVLLEEALDSLIDEIYPQVLDQAEIEPYGPGTLENMESTDPPVLDFLVPLAPEVTLGDYRDIRLPYEPAPVTDEDVEEVLARVQEDQAIVEPVDRPAQIGDIVYLGVRAYNVQEDGNPDLENPLVPERKLNIRVRDPEDLAEDEWPFPGFSAQLTDKEQGQDYNLEHSFPDEEVFDVFQGKRVRFELHVSEIKSRELPELTDEFAQTVGDYDTLEALRDFIRENLESSRLAEYNQEYDDQILEGVVEASTVKYPPQMVAREIEVLKEDLEERLAAQSLDLDIYLKTQEMSEEELDEDLRPAAESRIRRGLVLMEIASKEEIEVEQEDIEADVSRTIDQFYQLVSEEEARQRLTKDALQSLVNQTVSDHMATKTFERLRTIARGQMEMEADGESEPTEADGTEALEELHVEAEAVPEEGTPENVPVRSMAESEGEAESSQEDHTGEPDPTEELETSG